MVSPAINPFGSQSPTATVPPPGASVGERFLGRTSAYLIGLSLKRQSLGTAWLELLPSLSVAALAALALSIAVAWPLAASIARPLVRMTRAAEGIARGRFEQQIAVEGRDEIARLARAFNTMAREVSASQRTLRDFLANVSHDLRTPLTSVQGFAQALIDGLLTNRAEVGVAGRVIHDEATRMSRLVDDLLYLSRMESGQAPLTTRTLALAPLVTERLAAAAPRTSEAGIGLNFLPEPAPSVLGDPRHLERVVDNLLDNALRHTPRSGIVTVRLRRGNRAPTPTERIGTPNSELDCVLLSVHNTGSTIPPADLPRVFERFYQVDRSRTAGSSGLGLAIIREIAQAHGGRCWAKSGPEQGTEFFVELPAAPPAHDAISPETEVGSPLVSERAVLPGGSAYSARS